MSDEATAAVAAFYHAYRAESKRARRMSKPCPIVRSILERAERLAIERAADEGDWERNSE